MFDIDVEFLADTNEARNATNKPKRRTAVRRRGSKGNKATRRTSLRNRPKSAAHKAAIRKGMIKYWKSARAKHRRRKTGGKRKTTAKRTRKTTRKTGTRKKRTNRAAARTGSVAVGKKKATRKRIRIAKPKRVGKGLGRAFGAAARFG